jgi:hypothetical protein
MPIETGPAPPRHDLPVPARAVPQDRPERAAWSPETRAVAAAAAVSSFLALLTWLGVSWRYVQPSAFPRSSLLIGPPLSLDFAVFVLRVIFHAFVLAGAAAAALRHRWARILLLVGGLGVVGLGLQYFAKANLYPYSPHRGADVVYNLTDSGAFFVTMYLPHVLLVLVMAWPVARGRPVPEAAIAADTTAAEGGTVRAGRLLPYSDGTDGDNESAQVRRAVVLAAGVDAVASFARTVMLAWVALQPSAFRSIGTDRSYLTSVFTIGSVASELAILVGAAALLARRRWPLPLLLAGAALWLVVHAWGWTLTWVFPRGYLPAYRGAEWVVNVTADTSRILTMALVYVLLVFVLLRPHGRHTRWPV